jgi:hypothetical protein
VPILPFRQAWSWSCFAKPFLISFMEGRDGMMLRRPLNLALRATAWQSTAAKHAASHGGRIAAGMGE